MKLPKLVILDCDGTLYRGSELIPGAVEAVRLLRINDIAVRFVTNNSGITQQGIQQKLVSLGFDCQIEEVLGTARATGLVMKVLNLKSALVVGQIAVVEELTSLGIKCELAENLPVTHNSQFDAVVACLCKNLSYSMIAQAQKAIKEGAVFIATNEDAGLPDRDGLILPGAGATVGAIRGATLIEPKVIGKPEPTMLNMIAHECGVSPQEMFVVGDRYETDILFGKQAGCKTYQVLTGVSDEISSGEVGGKDLMAFTTFLGI